MILLSFVTRTAAAQATRSHEIEPNGEVAISILEDVNRQAQTVDKPIILIARLGTGETLRKWNLRRLHNVAARLYNVKQIIKTEGERMEGKGRVEIYFDGKLLDILLAHRHRDLAVDCCELFSDLYPWYNPAKDKKKAVTQPREETLTEVSPKVAYAVPDYSEVTGAMMAELNRKAGQSSNKLILVSRLGDGERSSKLHLHRLQAVESSLYIKTQKSWVLTQGEAVKGLGRVECYIDGVRELTLMTEQNEQFVMGCCELADNDPRWTRVRHKRKLRLAREKSFDQNHYKNNR